jgi:hypothetical protein
MKHVVLLGDSVLDNAAYVAGGPDVVTQVRRSLPGGWRATLAAADGAVTRSVSRQVERLPSDASHLVVSVGGNDALQHVGILDSQARSAAEVLSRLADIRDDFARDYRAMVEHVGRSRLPAALCTIYDGRLPDPQRRRIATTALTVFNDVITRTAFEGGFTLIDLRLICSRSEDYANPIEPSVIGGEKIAGAIVRFAAGHHDIRHRSEVLAW